MRTHVVSNVASASYGEPIPPQRVRTRSVGSLHQRFVAITLVVGIHVLGGLALLTQRFSVEHEPAPMIFRLLEAPTISERLPPPAVPHIELPQLPVAIMPAAIAFEDAAPTAIAVAPLRTPPESAPAVSVEESITEARFDVDYLDNAPPAYPSISRRMREEGLVVLKVKVRADGTADAVLVQRRSGSARLDEAALAAVRRWKFVPAKRGDQAIESWVLVPIEFELKA